jgi:hypothetical protein
MFGLPIRMAHGADANGAETNFGPHAARTAAPRATEVFWLALIAALFLVWAMSPSADQSSGLTASSPGCAFVGKAGVICRGVRVATESDSCMSFGRGGRYCPTK